MRKFVCCLPVIFYFFACRPATKNEGGGEAQPASSLDVKVYGIIGKDTVHQYTMTNRNGMAVKFLDYGMTVTDILVPDKNGKPEDVVLGFDSLGGYLQKDNPYFGCVVGRYANRIANAKFSLDGKTYQLVANNNGNSLHGGLKGFDKVMWIQQERVADKNSVRTRMFYESKDREEGYPGNLKVSVSYILTDDDEFRIDYLATTDKPTPVNLTNHSYFNLSGGSDSTILDHELMIAADKFTEVNDKLIPTGKLPAVKSTPMDFTVAKRIGKDIDKVKGGYDHNWVLNKGTDERIQLVATLYHQASGRYMEVFTTQPGLQFYSGNFLDGSLTGKNGKRYVLHGGLALETQHFPDSPNQPSFPNTILRPGEAYRQLTTYKFSIR